MTNIQYFFMFAGMAAVVGLVLWMICSIIISIIERFQRADIDRELERDFRQVTLKKIGDLENLLKKIADDQEGDGDA